jgi:hypothetical protein
MTPDAGKPGDSEQPEPPTPEETDTYPTVLPEIDTRGQDQSGIETKEGRWQDAMVRTEE